jgi:hypothetical protein
MSRQITGIANTGHTCHEPVRVHVSRVVRRVMPAQRLAERQRADLTTQKKANQQHTT